MAQARPRGRQLALTLLLGLISLGAVASPSNPGWRELTHDQQEALTPIKGEWRDMGPSRKKKWLGIAARYYEMSPDEQQRLTRRMQAWAKLTPEQRKQAREQYKRLRQLPPDELPALGQKWDQYKNLSPDMKSKAVNTGPSAPAGRQADEYHAIPAEWLLPPYLRPRRLIGTEQTARAAKSP
ncbi:DUF3106 domain-containing protein [Niveibacterium sp. SC-1]|uniref:DUF3106 domain-containing protein n=1 Tax=Niveibacterium sp. SC-1 TaxID=3135646 RepID=UPI00311ED6AC